MLFADPMPAEREEVEEVASSLPGPSRSHTRGAEGYKGEELCFSASANQKLFLLCPYYFLITFFLNKYT